MIEISMSLVQAIFGWGILIIMHIAIGYRLLISKKEDQLIAWISAGLLLTLIWVIAFTLLGVIRWVS